MSLYITTFADLKKQVNEKDSYFPLHVNDAYWL